MSFFLQKQDVVGANEKRFIYSGSRLWDALAAVYSDPHQHANINLSYILHGTKDLDNIRLLKEELGSDYLENMMLKQFTRHNQHGPQQDVIQNAYQKKVYDEFRFNNNLLASIFLYFFQRWIYDDVPNNQILLNHESASRFYAAAKTTGLSSQKIIDKIKQVYSHNHNLFVELLQEKYGDVANVGLMSVQNAQENLKEIELTGQIEKIKPKKLAKIERPVK